MTRLLVCGGREFNDAFLMFSVLDHVHALLRVSVLIHGAARGADTLADYWARQRGVDRLPFSVSVEEWLTIGRKAGPLRNARMLVEGLPDLVLGFPGGSGTTDMLRQARRAGVPTHVVGVDGITRPPLNASKSRPFCGP